MANRNGHTHKCACGTLLSCAYDRCAATSKTYICGACEADAMDTYINDLQAKLLAPKQPDARLRQR